ncbi:DUF2252 domain-containing protein [Beijerinckiaceae bacterium]|nr:DUF2252 domain-containing protein [Beijerinckiaceae bacterium]
MLIPPANGASLLNSTRAQRYAAGRALRTRVSRESHAECPPASDRDPLAILHATDATRIPELLPIRYQRMAVSPFTFLRGAAAVMAQDLATLPHVGAQVQACGDCHLMNFGASNTPEGRVLFDINDFDETLPGIDFTVDLKRLAASVAVAAIDAGMSAKKARALAQATVQSYRDFILELAKMTPLQIWYIRMDVGHEAKRIANVRLREKILSILVKAKKDLASDDNFPHLATTEAGVAHIEDRPPLIYHFDTEATKGYKIHAHSAFSNYQASLLSERRRLIQHYALSDIAFKVVGVGSVGTFCAIGLFMSADAEPLFLQVKEAQASVLEKIVGAPEVPLQQGNRVVEGQRALQAASDIFLGWTEDPKTKRHFYVRQLKNRRLGSIGEVVENKALAGYANLCGRTLARAHARTGDPALLAGYMGKSDVFDDAIAAFAIAYARQTKHDHALLKASLESSARPSHK